MRYAHSLILFASLALLFAAVGTSANAAESRPNFVFFLIDDLGWMDLSCYGSEYHETPNLDRFAESGIRFTDAYASCPVCSPTRASIMTGKYPARLGITNWIPGARPQNLPLVGPAIHNQLPHDEVTIAEVLHDEGYRTFFAGKWHLGGEGFWPEAQGFDVNKGGHRRGSPPGGYYTPYKNPALDDGPEGEYLTDRLTDESIAFLEANRRQPFLLCLSFYTVHTPIQACKRHINYYEQKLAEIPEPTLPAQIPEHDGFTKTRQDNAAYATMVHAMDENVGRLLDALDRLELSDDTVVVFTSDNGGRATLFRSGNSTANLPLRAGKGWCYEGGIRVPLIVRCPGITKPGRLCDVPVISTDFFPTMLDLAGIEMDAPPCLDGVTLMPLLQGKGQLDRETIYWHYPHYHGSAWKPGAALRSGDWKLVEFHESGVAELYNLANDLGEQNELSAKFPEKKAELVENLRQWRKSVGAKMATPNPKYQPAKKP